MRIAIVDVIHDHMKNDNNNHHFCRTVVLKIATLNANAVTIVTKPDVTITRPTFCISLRIQPNIWSLVTPIVFVLRIQNKYTTEMN